MSKYTPKIEEVAHTIQVSPFHVTVQDFDRWHAAEIRKAKAEGIRAAASACRTLLTMQMGEALPHEMLEEMDRMAARFGAPR